MRLIYQSQITKVGFLCLCRVIQADFKPMRCGGLFELAFYDSETGTTDRLNLARDRRFYSLRCFIEGLINIVIARPYIIGKLGISKRHFCSILVRHTEARKHRSVNGGILHKLLDIDTHFFIQTLNPFVGFLRLIAEASAKTSRDTIPFDRFCR